MSALSLHNVSVRYGRGATSMVAVDTVDLSIPEGKVLGLVGESGCGKSTLARAVAGLVPVSGGEIRVGNSPVAPGRTSRVDSRIQMVFQDPSGSLDPRLTVGQIVAEGVVAGRNGPMDIASEVDRLLQLVSLDPSHSTMLPSRLSGGQRQRVALARALGARPAVLIADEITAALDVSVQGSVLNVLRQVRREMRFSMLFISHNLAVVSAECDEIAVMYGGQIVEQAPTADLIGNPRHPYTRALLDAIPAVGRRLRTAPQPVVEADPPDPRDNVQGCRFHPRCLAGPSSNPDRTVCIEISPVLNPVGSEHTSACHFTNDLGRWSQELSAP